MLRSLLLESLWGEPREGDEGDAFSDTAPGDIALERGDVMSGLRGEPTVRFGGVFLRVLALPLLLARF